MSVQDQQTESVFQGSRATVVSPDIDTSAPSSEELDVVSDETSVEDDELDSLLDFSDDEETEGDTETLPETETSAGFQQEFEQHFGMSVEDAKSLVQELAQERADRQQRTQQQQVELQQRDLATHWGVDEGEVVSRLVVVKQYWDKLPEEKKAQYDNAEGAKAIYAKLVASGKANVPKLDRNSTKSASTGSPKYLYTEAQIRELQKNPEEYAKEADNILRAYQLGKVRK